MFALRFDIWWLFVGSLFWITCHCDVNSEELSLINKAAKAMIENAGGNSESGLLMLAPDVIQTGDGTELKPSYGRLRRDLWPDVKNRVNELMREMAEGALMLKAVFNSALAGNQQVEKKKVFITVAPPRSARLNGRAKPVQVKRPLPSKTHSNNGSTSMPPKHKPPVLKNKPNIKSVRKPTTFKFFDDSLLEQIEKREEERAEASLINEKPKYTENNNFESGGWFPVQADGDTDTKGKQPLKSQIVSNLNTNVMDQPLGKKVIYEKQIIPLKLTTENYFSSNYKVNNGFEPVYKQSESVNKPVAVSFNKDDNSKNHKQNQNQNQNYNQRQESHQLEVPNYSIDTYYNVPNKESAFKSPAETSTKVQQYDIPGDSNANYFLPTLKPTWHQQRLKKNTESFTPATTTQKPKPVTERPNYPEFFFEASNNDHKIHDQNHKQQQSRDSIMRQWQRPNDRRHIQSLTTTATSIINNDESSLTKNPSESITTRLNRLKSLKKTQSEFNITASTKQQINATNKPPKRGTIKYGDKFNN